MTSVRLRTDATAEVLPADVVGDYAIAFRSRVASEVSYREVFAGRAAFAIPGDGKEVAQVALAHAVRPGDWRAGYYRDQTLLLALGQITIRSYFANLYADSSVKNEPGGAGRQMANHYASRVLNDDYLPDNMLGRTHSAADLSPVSSHLPRLLGLAQASKLYRNDPALRGVREGFSRNGDEVAFGTIGNGGTTEGIFWETINAAGVLQIPMLLSVWDDGLAISATNDLQTTKGSISLALEGFRSNGSSGIELYVVRGDDYLALRETFARAAGRVRENHVPAVVHVTHMSQPLGHSSSGSHERYKTVERLAEERRLDPLPRLRAWILDQRLATEGEVEALELEERRLVEQERQGAWDDFQSPMVAERQQLLDLLSSVEHFGNDVHEIAVRVLEQPVSRGVIVDSALEACALLRGSGSLAAEKLRQFAKTARTSGRYLYGSHLYSQSDRSPLRMSAQAAVYSANSHMVDGRIVLRECFDANLARDPRILVLGEDVGLLGDVNLVFEGLQAKFGANRVMDTGLREATILGQGIGMAQRGFRPVVDIQYLDYVLYVLQLASDDLATLHHRTHGGQNAPVIIRTKGHRLQGMWHAGSPMAVLLHALRGIYLAVPRNMTQAAGMYNMLLRSDSPALVVETLNLYRLKEPLPLNVGEFIVPLGEPEILRSGEDLTIVTYGACCSVVLEAAVRVAKMGISAEVIDAQTLNPFDLNGVCAASVRRTGALLVVDEDVPGAASAFVLQQIAERDGAFDYVQVPPRTVSAAEHRTPFGRDGDYFTKPGVNDVIEAAYGIARERSPREFPAFL